MPISVTIPTLGKPRTVKDAIISVLSQDWPLTAKKIFVKVKNMNLDISYQAVHKTIQELLESEILVKQGKEYELNLEWLNKIENFGSNVSTKYETGQRQPMETLIERGIINLNFETFKHLSEFSLPIFVAECPNPENKIGICNFSHIYPMLGYSEKVYKDMKTLCLKYKFYSLCKYDTALDRWFADFFRKVGKKVKLGVNYGGEYDVIVVGDYVMQIFFTKEFKRDLDKLYKNTTNVGEVDLNELLSHVLEKRTDINVVIFKSPKVADQIRDDTLEYFKNCD
jgi:cellulose synthase/poly-beta-1,6-N-acetylglucosamine synthase-like glycosyltransferase